MFRACSARARPKGAGRVRVGLRVRSDLPPHGLPLGCVRAWLDGEGGWVVGWLGWWRGGVVGVEKVVVGGRRASEERETAVGGGRL